jgi:hypothetical protein
LKAFVAQHHFPPTESMQLLARSLAGAISSARTPKNTCHAVDVRARTSPTSARGLDC